MLFMGCIECLRLLILALIITISHSTGVQPLRLIVWDVIKTEHICQTPPPRIRFTSSHCKYTLLVGDILTDAKLDLTSLQSCWKGQHGGTQKAWEAHRPPLCSEPRRFHTHEQACPASAAGAHMIGDNWADFSRADWGTVKQAELFFVVRECIFLCSFKVCLAHWMNRPVLELHLNLICFIQLLEWSVKSY